MAFPQRLCNCRAYFYQKLTHTEGYMFDLPSEQLPIGALTPYEKNAKKHPKAQVQTIIDSIREFGMLDAIGVWGPTNLIVEGHGRLMACKKLGHKTVPVIRLDHLSDEQRRAYTLAHNKTTMNSDFDTTLLNTELAGITDLDMSLFGFDLDIGTAEVLEDDFEPELPDEPVTKSGDISITWQKQFTDRIAPFRRMIKGLAL